MIIKLLLLFFFWLVLRRFWRSLLMSRSGTNTRQRPQSRPAEDTDSQPDLGNITQQEISEAEFEELDDK